VEVEDAPPAAPGNGKRVRTAAPSKDWSSAGAGSRGAAEPAPRAPRARAPARPPPPPPSAAAAAAAAAAQRRALDDVVAFVASVPELSKPTCSRSRSWTPEEDETVRRLVREHGLRKWAFIATFLAGKTQKQVYARWRDYLQPSLTTAPWTREEQKQLLELQAQVGNQWAELAKLLPGRSVRYARRHARRCALTDLALFSQTRSRTDSMPPSASWSGRIARGRGGWARWRRCTRRSGLGRRLGRRRRSREGSVHLSEQEYARFWRAAPRGVWPRPEGILPAAERRYDDPGQTLRGLPHQRAPLFLLLACVCGAARRASLSPHWCVLEKVLPQGPKETSAPDAA